MKTKYYQRNKERLQKDASERYKNHFIEEKIKNRKKAREKYWKKKKFFGRRKT